MKAVKLAQALGYELVGNGEVEVKSIAYAAQAADSELAVAKSKQDIIKTNAHIVLTTPRFLPTDKALMYCCEDVSCAAVKAAKVLIEAGELPDYTQPIKYAPLTSHVLAGRNCVIGNDAKIGPWCSIGDNVRIGNHCVIEPYVWIGSGTVIGDHVTVHSGARIGIPAFFHYADPVLMSFSGIGVVRIECHSEIGANTILQRGTFSDTVIGQHTMIGNLVDIGHDVHIGNSCKIVSQTGIAGNVTVGNYVQIFGQVGIANNVLIQDHATIMAKSLVSKNIGPGMTVSGPYGRSHKEELRMRIKLQKLVNKTM